MSSSLKNMFYRLMDKYAEIYAEVNRTQKYKHSFGEVIRKDIPNKIYSSKILDQSKYKIKGSNGAGRWTTVPWIAIFDKCITESAQSGVYLVYLLNKDKKELFLTLNQGTTEITQYGIANSESRLTFTGVAGTTNSKVLDKLRENALHMQSIIGDIAFNTDDKMDCGASSYNAGAVCYKKYTLDNLPEDNKLYEDLKGFIAIYNRYVEWYKKNTNSNTTSTKLNDDKNKDVKNIDNKKEMTIKEKVTAIKTYIAAKGFNYEGDLIENFYLSLKSKPFVILAGTSGTGKTRLVKLFAEAIGAKMQLVPVRPDWSDSSDLFGHNDLSGNFHPGAIIDFIKQAEQDQTNPYFLCLDEMNLARVEYYLSDFLSIVETRDRKVNDVIETDTLIDLFYFQSQAAREKYGRVFIPENLYVIGTVNMDETTFPFSKKVLDRANTIEFSFVDLKKIVVVDKQVVPQKLDNVFLKTDYLYLYDCEDEDLINDICFNLEELNQILVKANLHVGYRVRDEISFYMMNNKKIGLLDFNKAFDYEIMQKILPRVQGSSVAIKDVLSELFIKCAGDYTGYTGATAYEQMNSYLNLKTAKYSNSAKKIVFMMRRYEEDGFTSYWL